MDHKIFHEKFLLLEERLNLDEFEIDNIPVWELIRPHVYSKIRHKIFNVNLLEILVNIVTNLVTPDNGNHS
jgi:hypothetical protein